MIRLKYPTGERPVRALAQEALQGNPLLIPHGLGRLRWSSATEFAHSVLSDFTGWFRLPYTQPIIGSNLRWWVWWLSNRRP